MRHAFHGSSDGAALHLTASARYLIGGDALPSFIDGSRSQTRNLPNAKTKAEVRPRRQGQARPHREASAMPAFSSKGIADWW